MASVKIILRVSKMSNGHAPLYLRIIKGRKAKFVSLGSTIKPSEWNEEIGKVRKSHPNSGRLNSFIAQKIAEAENIGVELESKSKNVSSLKIKERIVGKAPTDFFVFAKKYLIRVELSDSYATYKRYKSVIEKIKTYVEKGILPFDEINVGFLKDYELYLSSKKSNRINTIHSNMRVLRKILNDAVAEDLMPREENPFYRFKLKSEKTQRQYLTSEELLKIEQLELSPLSMLHHHRNLYVFACYAGGLRISDALQLKWSNFDGERLNIKIHKTGTPLSIKLPDKALSILNSYKKSNKTKATSTYIFPLLKASADADKKTLFNAISSATAYTNKDLKTITKKAKITKHISFHTSRHTWATLALKKGMRIEYVSKLMGHAAIKETQIYAKIVNEELDKAMEIFN